MIVGLMIYNSIASQEWHKENLGQESITESEYFYWRLFYYNSNDNRIFVPKRTGGGFTINFANPLSITASILVVAGFVILIIFKI